MRRMTCMRALSCALVGLGLVACSSGGAQPELVGSVTAPLEPGKYVLKSAVDGSCLQPAGASLGNGADVVTAQCSSGAEQQWEFVRRPKGSFRIVNAHSHKCLRARKDSEVVQGRCVYRRSKWNVIDLGASEIQLESARTGQCASGPGSISQEICVTGSTPAQTFLAEAAQCPPLPSCNWCGGDDLFDGDGCVTGWICANGIDPCAGAGCQSETDCGPGEVCDNMLCWPADPTTVSGQYTLVGNPCNTDPCPPGLVGGVVTANDTYIVTVDGGWIWNEDWSSWSGYVPQVGEQVVAEGRVSYHADLYGVYLEIELASLSPAG